MIFLEKRQLKQEKVPAGQVLVLQGSPCHSLNIVHSGQIETLVCTQNQYVIPPEEIINKSRRISVLGPNSTPGALSLIQNKPYMYSYRTLSECVISTFPANQQTLPRILAGRLSIGLLIFRNLISDILEIYKLAQHMSALNEFLARFSDNLCLAWAFFNPQVFKELEGANEAPAPVGGNIDPVLPSARVLYSDFKDKGGEFPTPFNLKFIDADHSHLLNKDYSREFEFDMERLNYYRRLLKLDSKLQATIYQSDIQILMYALKDLAAMTLKLNNQSFQFFQGLVEMSSNIVQGQYCLVEKFTLTSDLAADGFGQFQPSEFYPVVRHLLATVRNLQTRFEKVFGCPLEVTPRLADLEAGLAKEPVPEKSEEEPEKAAGGENSEALAELKDSAKKIMNFVDYDIEKQKELVDLLTTFKETKNPLDSDPDKRKLRRNISKFYWEIYEAVLTKWINQGRARLPLYCELMLDFGFFDDRLLEDDALVALANMMDRTSSHYPVLYAREFLADIFEKKSPPSTSELGQSFIDILREKHNQPRWRKETDLPSEVDTGGMRLEFELHQELMTTTRLTSGTPTTHFPILVQDHLVFELENMWITKERLSKVIHDLLEIDYSAFFREVLVNDEAAGIYKEFVQTEVIPNFVIVPSIGSKMMMWQDFEARSKQSPGRIFVPALNTADLFSMLVDAVGAFRWELCKTIQGVDWNNVGVSSITADYMDYLQFFRKNKDLSIELKEKIHTELKKFRTDRDKFINDYQRWIKSESKGILKLNKVTRNIFYRHAPFSKAIRDELKSQPAYAEIATRFANIRNRKKKELETRYKKYTKEGQALPRLLQENVEFYSI